MGSRRHARECALKLLFQKQLNDESNEFLLEEFWNIENVHKDSKEFAEELFKGTITHINEIDEIIEKCALNWDMSRIANIDINIIRIALYEILYLNEIPVIVSINEAIDIAKKYSTVESGKFVNGILDKAKKIIGDNINQRENGKKEK